jgi:hypothetical protein
MMDADDMSEIEMPAPLAGIEMPVTASGIDWDALNARLVAAASGSSATALPSYRRIWFQSLIRQGREAEGAGRTVLAKHCFARLEQEFKTLGVPQAAEAARGGEIPAASTADVPVSLRHDAARAAGSPSGSSTTSSSPHSPLKALAARRVLAAHARLKELLDRHDFRLPPDEAAVFRQALDASVESVSGGVTISDLRRRLVDRLMRAARYRRQAARLATWKPAPPAAVSGPYNDYRALEDLLHRIAAANPHAAEWAAEFFDIYADMRDARIAYGTLLPGK